MSGACITTRNHTNRGPAPEASPAETRQQRSKTMALTADQQTTLTRVAEQLAAEMSEEQLLREIGLRARTFAMFPAAANSIEKSVPEAAALERAWDDLTEFGGWIFRRLHRQLQSVATEGGAGAAGRIVSALTARLGVAPAIASVFAALAVKRLLQPAWEETYAPRQRMAAEA